MANQVWTSTPDAGLTVTFTAPSRVVGRSMVTGGACYPPERIPIEYRQSLVHIDGEMREAGGIFDWANEEVWDFWLNPDRPRIDKAMRILYDVVGAYLGEALFAQVARFAAPVAKPAMQSAARWMRGAASSARLTVEDSKILARIQQGLANARGMAYKVSFKFDEKAAAELDRAAASAGVDNAGGVFRLVDRRTGEEITRDTPLQEVAAEVLLRAEQGLGRGLARYHELFHYKDAMLRSGGDMQKMVDWYFNTSTWKAELYVFVKLVGNPRRWWSFSGADRAMQKQYISDVFHAAVRAGENPNPLDEYAWQAAEGSREVMKAKIEEFMANFGHLF